MSILSLTLFGRVIHAFPRVRIKRSRAEKAEGPGFPGPSHCLAPSAYARVITPPSDARRRRSSAQALRKPRDNETLDHLLSVVDVQVCHHDAAPFKPLFRG